MSETPVIGVQADGAALVSAMSAVGQQVEAPANAPLRPVGPTVWAVCDGALDVFVQSLEGGRPGTRHLVAEVRSGEVLIGADPSGLPDGTSLLAVERPESRLVAVGLDRFDDAARAQLETLATPGDLAATAGAVLAAAHDAGVTRHQVVDSLPRRNRDRLDEANVHLARVMDRHRDDPLIADARNPADVALAAVGQYLGVRFAPVASVRDDTDIDLVHWTRRAGGRARAVRLRGSWWRRGAEPLIGFLGETKDPVALLPSVVPGRYLVVDPATGERRGLDQATASRLAPEAVAFTAPLTERAEAPGRMLAFAMGHGRRSVRTLFVAGLLAAVMALVIPLATSAVFNDVIPQADESLLIQVAALLLGGVLAAGALSLVQNMALLRLEGLAEARLQPALWDRLLRLGTGFFRHYTTGDLVNRVQGVDTIRQLLAGSVVTSLLGLVFSSVNLIIIFHFSAQLAVVALAVIAVAFAMLVFINLRRLRLQRRAFTIYGSLFGFVFQLLASVPKIRVAGAETRAMGRWAQLYRRQQRLVYQAGRLQVAQSVVIALLPTSLVVAVVVYTGQRLQGQISSGAFLAFLSAAGAFVVAVSGVTYSLGPLFATIPLYERFKPVVVEPPAARPDARDPGPLRGQVRAQNLTFRYDPDSPVVLDGVDIAAEPGEFVAITGPSGSGKSTLLRVLLGLEEPQAGAVFFDAQDLALLDASEVRRQVGVVMQEARPLPGSVYEAIVGGGRYAPAQVWQAVEDAGLTDDIQAMPMGLHTMIGASDGALSGGQLQRILLARALLARPKVVVLDEATSALDNRVQKHVTDSLAALDATRIVVAHRLSTIRGADRIYVLDAGKVVQMGTFDELYADEDGLFRRLVSRQMLRAERAEQELAAATGAGGGSATGGPGEG